MSKKKREDGGQAFPCDLESGMSLRDWFAGQYLAGRAARNTIDNRDQTADYAIADAMIAEREK